MVEEISFYFLFLVFLSCVYSVLCEQNTDRSNLSRFVGEHPKTVCLCKIFGSLDPTLPADSVILIVGSFVLNIVVHRMSGANPKGQSDEVRPKTRSQHLVDG